MMRRFYPGMRIHAGWSIRKGHDIQLVTEQRILGLKTLARLEQVGAKNCDDVQSLKHHVS